MAFKDAALDAVAEILRWFPSSGLGTQLSEALASGIVDTNISRCCSGRPRKRFWRSHWFFFKFPKRELRVVWFPSRSLGTSTKFQGGFYEKRDERAKDVCTTT